VLTAGCYDLNMSRVDNAEKKAAAAEFVRKCEMEDFDDIQDLVYGIGWKWEKAKKKGEEPTLKQGENPQNVNVHNDQKETPLYVACKKGRLDVAELLLKNGADANFANLYGYTPLYWASERGDESIVKALLAANADPNILTTYNHTALSRAKLKGHTEIEYLLEKAGGFLASPKSIKSKDLNESPDVTSAAVKERVDRSFDALIESQAWISLHPLPPPGSIVFEEEED